jgi:hypothetical protein
MNRAKIQNSDHRILMAFFQDEARAKKALHEMLAADMTMDRISILGQASSSGDDPLGVYYPSIGEKMLSWGKMGAFWGGVWGALTGAVGLFLIPGLGPFIAAGPIAEAMVGAAGGAGLAAGVMAGAGAASQLGVAIHRMGIPQRQIERFHDLLESGHYMLMVVVDRSEIEHWRTKLAEQQPELLADHPYVGYVDALDAAVA